METGNDQCDDFFQGYANGITTYLQGTVAPEIKRILADRVQGAIGIERDHYEPIIAGDKARIEELEGQLEQVQEDTAAEYQSVIDELNKKIAQLERNNFLNDAIKIGGGALGGWLTGQFLKIPILN